MEHKFTKGIMVQMTRLGLRKQYAGVYHKKDENSYGTFVRYDGGSFGPGKRSRALIIWYTGKRFPPSYQQLTRLDYLEPRGTKR